MASQAIATRDNTQENRLAVFGDQLEKRALEFKRALPAHISPERFQRTILTAVQTEPQLLAADRHSLITACYKAAQDGLLPDKREAALVVFNNRQKDSQGNWHDVKVVQYMPMVYGLRKKILQSGEIKALNVGVVYREEVEAGCFHYEEGTDRCLRHRPLELVDPNFVPRDENIVAAYSVAVLNDGTVDPHVVYRSYINKVRQCSQTGATGRTIQFGKDKGKKIEPKGPWVDWFPEQCMKTAMRSHSKTLPMSGDIVDVEAQELSETAQSVGAVLSYGGDDGAPRLPTRAETAAEDYDPSTGEIHDQDETPDEETKKAATPRKRAQQKAPDSQQEGCESQQQGDEPHPAQKKADEIVAEAGTVKNIMDLNSLRSRVKNDVAAMPEDIAAGVDEALDGAEARIRGGN